MGSGPDLDSAIKRCCGQTKCVGLIRVGAGEGACGDEIGVDGAIWSGGQTKCLFFGGRVGDVDGLVVVLPHCGEELVLQPPWGGAHRDGELCVESGLGDKFFHRNAQIEGGDLPCGARPNMRRQLNVPQHHAHGGVGCEQKAPAGGELQAGDGTIEQNGAEGDVGLDQHRWGAPIRSSWVICKFGPRALVDLGGEDWVEGLEDGHTTVFICDGQVVGIGGPRQAPRWC